MKRLALLLIALLPVTALPDMARAEAGFTSSLRANRRTASANSNYHRGQYEQARAGYLRAKDLTGETEPEVADLHFNIGATFYKDGNYAEADKEFQVAAGAVDPVLRQEALYNLGNVSFQQGLKAKNVDQLKKAAEYYQQALQLNPQDEDARFNLEVVRRHIKLEQQKQKQQQQPKACPNPKPGDQQNQKDQQNQQGQQGQQQQQQGQQQPGQQNQKGQQQQPGSQNQKDQQNQKGQQAQQQQQPGQQGQQQPKPAGQGQDAKQKGKSEPQPAAGGTAEPKPKKGAEQAQPVQPTGSTQRQGKLTKEEADRILQAVEQQEQQNLKQVMQGAPGEQRSRERDW